MAKKKKGGGEEKWLPRHATNIGWELPKAKFTWDNPPLTCALESAAKQRAAAGGPG